MHFGGAGDGDAFAAHGFGGGGPVGVVELPEPVGSGGSAAVDAFVERLFLVEGGVVVDDGDGANSVAGGGVEFGEVVPHAAVAGEADDRAVGGGAPGPDGGGQAPAQGAGAADEALAGRGQVDEGSGPDAGVAGVGNQDGVGWEVAGEFVAEALGAHRHLVGGQEGVDLGSPGAHEGLYALDPGLS